MAKIRARSDSLVSRVRSAETAKKEFSKKKQCVYMPTITSAIRLRYEFEPESELLVYHPKYLQEARSVVGSHLQVSQPRAEVMDHAKQQMVKDGELVHTPKERKGLPQKLLASFRAGR
ncbi:unnamed protein product [Vitrella brassicaformis CCMP3155]|uniref:Uncharacterized protein n=1 Tax=Vitrella brassicaformis (strain CCMP3155) TaxID=1169540 RepID=A0A0G4E8G1_VITBC|nr:unnamed protein product [Vitrella brassicaformis CCMP3155]|eukprot:CEL92033.1 unnamed protein product [Vitrella brassicaformis CCMP3155]